MANTVTSNHLEWNGTRGMLHYVLTSDGTDLSDLNVLDISALAPAPSAVKIRTIQWSLYGVLNLTMEFDASTDIAVCTAENQTVDSSFEYVRDFTDGPNSGWCPNKAAAGFVGDILLTGAMASGDGFDLLVTFEQS